MGNPLFDALGGNRGNIANEFQNFVHKMRGRNPHEEINRLLRSGAITQQQLNRAQQMAQQMQGLIGSFKR